MGWHMCRRKFHSQTAQFGHHDMDLFMAVRFHLGSLSDQVLSGGMGAGCIHIRLEPVGVPLHVPFSNVSCSSSCADTCSGVLGEFCLLHNGGRQSRGGGAAPAMLVSLPTLLSEKCFWSKDLSQIGKS